MKRMIAILVFIISFGSCASDHESDLKSESGEQDILFAVNISGGVATRANSDTESRIDQLDLLVFKDGMYRYRREAYPSGDMFRATLKHDDSITIYAFANCRDLLNEYEGNVLVEGKSWNNDIRAGLTASSPFSIENNVKLLPMWGGAESIRLSQGVVNNIGTISLLRSIAAAEIESAENESIFKLTEAYLYFAASIGYLAPLLSNYDTDNGYVREPESPLSMETNITVRATEVENKKIRNQLYMFENDVDNATMSSTKRYTRLVIGGQYRGSENTTYYPVDFQENNEVLRVPRNHKYVIVIKEVGGEGYPTPEIASTTSAVNMDFDVIEWNFSGDNIYIDGPGHMSLEGNRKILFERYAGQQRSILVNTSFTPGEITMEFVEEYNGQAVTGENSISNDRFKAQIMTDIDGTVVSLVVTALQGYSNDNNTNLQTLRLKAGRILLDINIEQTNESLNDWDDGGDMEVEIGTEEKYSSTK